MTCVHTQLRLQSGNAADSRPPPPPTVCPDFAPACNCGDEHNGMAAPSYTGTHVAGTIGAVGNNVGVVGVCTSGIKLISLRFLGPNGGSTSDAVSALNYLVTLKKNGVNVVASRCGGNAHAYSRHPCCSAGCRPAPPTRLILQPRSYPSWPSNSWGCDGPERFCHSTAMDQAIAAAGAVEILVNMTAGARRCDGFAAEACRTDEPSPCPKSRSSSPLPATPEAPGRCTPLPRASHLSSQWRQSNQTAGGHPFPTMAPGCTLR